MKKMAFPFIIFCLLLTIVSCEDSLDFSVENYQQSLVIEGWIEQDKYPVVVLTRSSAYFAKIDSNAIRDLVVTTAKVTVSDGIKSEILTLKKNDNFFPPYIYEGTELLGQEGKSYHLTVESQGRIYQASTHIPARPIIDSLWFSLEEGKDSLGYIYGRYQDNPNEENYYRTFTWRKDIDKKYIPVYLSATGDLYFNGKEFTFSLLRGSESFSEITDDIYFKVGDTVRVKFCSIDRAHFDFWRTIERELYTVGNPFSSSGNQVISNLGDGALGVWGGYGASYYQIVLRKP